MQNDTAPRTALAALLDDIYTSSARSAVDRADHDRDLAADIDRALVLAGASPAPAASASRVAGAYQASVPRRIVAPCPACRGTHVAAHGPWGMPVAACAAVPAGTFVATR
jgi:hypothetical protein